MKIRPIVAPLTLWAALCIASPWSFADDAAEFVDEASAKGLAEVQAGDLALQKTNDPEVMKFAQQMIVDHTRTNQQLEVVSKGANIKRAEKAALIDKAQATLSALHDEKNFDAAYVRHQVAAHEETIKLFSAYAETGENPALKDFAQQTLPALKHHLDMARALEKRHPATE